MSLKQQLLVEMYRDFNARRADDVLAHMHTDVDWPNGMEGGRVHGREAVRAYWQRQWAMLNPTVDPVGFDEHDDQVAVRVHQVVLDLDGNLLIDQMVEHLYTFRGGLIDRMDIR